jgi:hypothetical protein
VGPEPCHTVDTVECGFSLISHLSDLGLVWLYAVSSLEAGQDLKPVVPSDGGAIVAAQGNVAFELCGLDKGVVLGLGRPIPVKRIAADNDENQEWYGKRDR